MLTVNIITVGILAPINDQLPLMYDTDKLGLHSFWEGYWGNIAVSQEQ